FRGEPRRNRVISAGYDLLPTDVIRTDGAKKDNWKESSLLLFAIDSLTQSSYTPAQRLRVLGPPKRYLKIKQTAVGN
ncbi:MAG: hypothetical protein ACRD72_16085, partial [Candidatus Angelobacter sp.]